MNTDNIYLIEYNDRVIGCYTDRDQAELFIYSCQQNKLMTANVQIVTYRNNSCYSICRENITLKPENYKPFTQLPCSTNDVSQLVSTDNSVSQSNNSIKHDQENNDKHLFFQNPVVVEIAKQKIELQHRINMLKIHKERMEESKKVFKNDMKLFELFENSKKDDPSFNIPDLFKEKYSVMTKLRNEDQLNWESFVREYQPENNYNDYFSLNQYEEGFLDLDNISEELDIESESDTVTSQED